MTLHPKCILLRKNELIVGRWIWCRTVSTECAVWSVRCNLELHVETCNIWALESELCRVRARCRNLSHVSSRITALPTLCSSGWVLQDNRLPRPNTLLCFTFLFPNYPLYTIPAQATLSIPAHQATPNNKDQHAAGLPTTIELLFHTWRGVLRILHNFWKMFPNEIS